MSKKVISHVLCVRDVKCVYGENFTDDMTLQFDELKSCHIWCTQLSTLGKHISSASKVLKASLVQEKVTFCSFHNVADHQ